jgi:hypothetical protein
MSAPPRLHGGFEESELYDVLKRACGAAGIQTASAELLRGHTNAVLRLTDAPVVVKIARRGTPLERVKETVAFVQWLMDRGFPTVPLYPTPGQPIVVDGHPVTFWRYLPQPDHTVSAASMAPALRSLHSLPPPPVNLRRIDNLSAIRASIDATSSLEPADLEFLSDHANRLEHKLRRVDFLLPEGVVQGDPQHRNALHHEGGTVLCDWDTVAWGQPEWDLTTLEIHCRRFGYGRKHYDAFAEAYGVDVTAWPGYPTLRDIRELRMITTNARKASHTPGTVAEIERRIVGLRHEDPQLAWNIL